MHSFDLSLYLVTDSRLSLGRTTQYIVEQAVRGGVTMVQLREKEMASREFIDLAVSVKGILEGSGVPLIINDRVDVALASGADGVHLGQSDMRCDDARRLLGPGSIIGLSVENREQALEPDARFADYLAVSPVFGTPTKTDTAPPAGLEGLSMIASCTDKPVAAIGGINAGNISDVIRAGAAGAAVVSAIVSAGDVASAAAELLESVRRAR